MSSSSALAQKNQSQQVTLRGSAQLVSQFFNYGINSILYQRGIYPSESFTRKQEYGLTLLVSTDEKVNKFLKNVLSQIQDWLVERKVKKLVVVLTSVETNEILERWEFKVEYETEDETEIKKFERMIGENVDPNVADETGAEDGVVKRSKNYCNASKKGEKTIKQEIRDVIRQITASVSFLPLIDCICSFDILIYTHKNLDVPREWGESDGCLIQNSEEVKLRSFSTNIHRVEAAVSYKADL